jgi:hypothetical protein
VDVWIIGVFFSFWVVGDVEPLALKIVQITDAMLVIARVPDISVELLADREGEAAFDELKTSCSSSIDGRCDEDMDVIWHGDEGVESEAALITIAEEDFNHEFGVCSALKDAVALVGENRDGVSL